MRLQCISDVRFRCAFPFVYKGNEYYECINFDHPAGNDGQPWCSIDPEFSGLWVNCGVNSEYGCGFMNDKTGLCLGLFVFMFA